MPSNLMKRGYDKTTRIGKERAFKYDEIHIAGERCAHKIGMCMESFEQAIIERCSRVKDSFAEETPILQDILLIIRVEGGATWLLFCPLLCLYSGRRSANAFSDTLLIGIYEVMTLTRISY